MVTDVVGRDRELEAVERFLDALADGPHALVFEGPAGIGKTTLVRAAAQIARDRGARVLACAASASETRLSYVGLGDLLDGIDETLMAALPDPQRDALRAALLRADPGPAAADWRAVAMAVRTVVETLAHERPVVVAIDDGQWLDPPTARVLEFCARRLVGRVGLVASARTDADPGDVAGMIARGNPLRVEHRRVGPLTPTAINCLLRDRVPAGVDRRALDRVRHAAAGNPFYALELARAIGEDDMPASLREVVDRHVAGLGGDVEEALLAVAALAEPTVELVAEAVGPGARELLDRAEEGGVIEHRGRHVRFTHPLLSSGVYARATPARRRAMHRRLSAIVADVEERARHLAHALIVPEALRALDEAARHVHARGAPAAAAELLELALDLQPSAELRVRAAEHRFEAGDPTGAEALLGPALAELPAGPTRVVALLLLAELRYKDDSWPEARMLLEQARAQTGVDGSLRVMVDLRLTFALFNLGQPAEAAAVAREALAIAEQIADPPLLSQALGVSVMVDFAVGLGVDEGRLARALELESPRPRTNGEFTPSLIAALLFMWTGRLEQARALLHTLCARHAERGEEHDLAWTTSRLVWLEAWAGDLAAAEQAADDAAERLLALETRSGRAMALGGRALVDAYAGRADAARRGATEAFALLADARWQVESGAVVGTLGFLELSLGDFEAAAARLAPMAAMAVATGMPEPVAGGILFHGDAAEALIAVGRLEEAEPLVALLEERGAALQRPWAIAVGARCRGLVHAARGDAAAAEEALHIALAAHERLPMPLERARSLLVLGRVQRRLRKRLAAKATLEEALERFEAIGAELWARHARTELASIGLRPGSASRLTPSEERVARLAASGLVNRKVAAALHVSPKTVEAHLARAYRKLGIRTRAELGARMAQLDAATPAPAGGAPPPSRET